MCCSPGLSNNCSIFTATRCQASFSLSCSTATWVPPFFWCISPQFLPRRARSSPSTVAQPTVGAPQQLLAESWCNLWLDCGTWTTATQPATSTLTVFSRVCPHGCPNTNISGDSQLHSHPYLELQGHLWASYLTWLSQACLRGTQALVLIDCTVSASKLWGDRQWATNLNISNCLFQDLTLGLVISGPPSET